MERRTVDKSLLAHMTLGALGCKLAERLLEAARSKVSLPLQDRINKHYAVRLFEARARLDLPTFDDSAVQRQLDSASSVNGQGVAWGTISMVSGLVSTFLKIATQVTVLATVLKSQRDGLLLAVLCLIPSLSDYMNLQSAVSVPGRGGVYMHLWSQYTLLSLSVHSMGCNYKERGICKDGRARLACWRRRAPQGIGGGQYGRICRCM